MKDSILRRLILKVSGLLTALYIMGHVMQLWSHIYRFVWSRKHKDDVLQKLNLDEAAKKMAGFQWRADSWRALWDVVDSPQAVQAHGFDPATRDDNDCSDEAVYLSNVIEDPKVQKTEFMVVDWYNPVKGSLNAGFDGHCVCLITQLGLLRYMDYGQPNALHSTELEVAQEVVKHYTNGNGILISWHVSSKDLVPLRGQRVV